MLENQPLRTLRTPRNNVIAAQLASAFAGSLKKSRPSHKIGFVEAKFTSSSQFTLLRNPNGFSRRV